MDFTQMAIYFDTPRRRERARIISCTIQEYLDENTLRRGMEYGCGTGLVGLSFANKFKELVLVDPSPGMIAQVEVKKQENSLSHVTSMCGNFLDGLSISSKFDCIFTSMALHHEPNVPLLFKTLFGFIEEGAV